MPELGSFTPNTTGNKTLLTNGGGTPTYIKFWVGPRTATIETAKNLHSHGVADVTNDVATWESFYSDVNGNFYDRNDAGAATGGSQVSCLRHYAFPSGVATKIIELKFVSVAAGQFVVNVVTADSAYTVFTEVYF